MKKAIFVCAIVLLLGGLSSAGTIRVTSPNGSETWRCGERHPITWTSSGCGDRVKIDLISGTETRPITARTENTEGSNSWSWTIPDDIPTGSNYFVEITTVRGTSCSDRGEAAFTIQCAVTPALTLTSPNGDESWEPGSYHDITWDSSGITAQVKLILFKKGIAEGTKLRIGEIATGLAIGTGSYRWHVGDYIGGSVAGEALKKYLVRIETMDGAYNDESDAPFAIFRVGRAIVTPPIIVTPKPDFTVLDVFLRDWGSGQLAFVAKVKNQGATWTGQMPYHLTYASLDCKILGISRTFNAGETQDIVVCLFPASTFENIWVFGCERNCMVKVNYDGRIEETRLDNNEFNKVLYVFLRPYVVVVSPVEIVKDGTRLTIEKDATVTIRPEHALRRSGTEIIDVWVKMKLTLKSCGDIAPRAGSLSFQQDYEAETLLMDGITLDAKGATLEVEPEVKLQYRVAAGSSRSYRGRLHYHSNVDAEFVFSFRFEGF